MKGFIFTLLLVSALTGFGYAADTNNPPPDYKGQVAERPILVKGDRWHYNRRDKILSYEFIEEKDGQLVFLVGWEDGKKGKEMRTPDLNFIKGYSETCDPYRGALKFPLYVGKKWTHTYTSSKYKQSGGTGDELAVTDSSVKVVAYEQIKVPAGTFWAYKIEENRSVRGSKSLRGYNVTVWYSPEVRHNIKSEEDNDVWNMELLKFTPGK